MYSIPGRRMDICKHQQQMLEDHEVLQMTAGELKRLELMMAKLKVLETGDASGCLDVAARVCTWI